MALNLAAIATITAKTAYLLNPGTSLVVFVPTVTGAANQVIKINSVYVANTTAGSLNATVSVVRTTISGTFNLCTALAVAANTTTVVVTKDSPIYLEEDNDVLKAFGSASGLTFTVSYEILA